MARILIIEDEPTINMILREVLTDEGYEVDTAPEGRSGLNILRGNSNFNLVIADLRMPDLSGKAVVEAMRSDANLKDIPVIIITGAVPDSDEFPAPESYQATFGKPFDLMDILAKVEELV